jgi:hypothetical protein
MVGMSDLFIKQIPATDPRLKRHIVHDPESLNYKTNFTVDQSTWRNKRIRIYDPIPNPNQTNGCCTAVSQAVLFNAKGNRRKGVVLDMDWVQRLYTRETQIDPFPGSMPTQDTGSNGLAGCKASQEFGEGGEYRWFTNGTDEIVQAIMEGWCVSVGTAWENNMFNIDSRGVIHRGGGVAGGHQWTLHGYNVDHDYLRGICWWGSFKTFFIARSDVEDLLADHGDAHIQVRAQA